MLHRCARVLDMEDPDLRGLLPSSFYVCHRKLGFGVWCGLAPRSAEHLQDSIRPVWDECIRCAVYCGRWQWQV